MTAEMKVLAATGTAGASATASIIATALPVVQLIAGIIAIIAGVFAIAVSIKKLRN